MKKTRLFTFLILILSMLYLLESCKLLEDCDCPDFSGKKKKARNK